MANQTHRWVIDVLEENAASVEVDGGTMITIPRWLLPGAAREGDVLRVTHDRSPSEPRALLTIEVDAAAKQEALAKSSAQIASAKRKARINDPGGDITL